MKTNLKICLHHGLLDANLKVLIVIAEKTQIDKITNY